MRGIHRVIVQNAVVRYDFELRRNITVIRGDSATGKTTLVELIQEFYENGEGSGIELRCDCVCSTLSGRDWKLLLSGMHERIIFIDEGNSFVLTDEFAAAVRDSDNYYVIVSREGLANLPYSVEEIYGIRESGKYATLKQTYNEFYRIYGRNDYTKPVRPDHLLVEDSNSGYQFFQGLSKSLGWSVATAAGKSNIFSILIQEQRENVLVIADGAAFGAEMNRLVKLMKDRRNIVLYLPESFEWLILKSGLIRNNRLAAILEAPQDYIESQEYFSWERFFTKLLVDETTGTWLKYTKKTLNPAYLEKNAVSKICDVMEEIELNSPVAD